MNDKIRMATISLFAVFAFALLFSLGTVPNSDATTDNEQIRLDKKILDIEKNEKKFQELVQKTFELEGEIANREHIVNHGDISESQKITNMARISQLQEKLNQVYKEMNDIQTIHYKLYEVPAEKLSRISTIYNDLKQEFSQRGDATPLVDLYIDHKTEELVFIKTFNKKLSDSDKATIQEKANDVKYQIKELDKQKHSNCLARSNNCNPMLGGLKVQVSGTNSIGTLGFPAVRNGDTGFVITAHQADYRTGGTVYQFTATAGTVEDMYGTGCDCAFVDHYSTKSTDEKIWISGYGRFTITSESDEWSDHSVGTLLRKSGIKSGVTSGSISSTEGNYVYTTIYTERGDSGSPVYAGTGKNGMLYGLLHSVSTGTNNGVYTPYHIAALHLELD